METKENVVDLNWIARTRINGQIEGKHGRRPEDKAVVHREGNKSGQIVAEKVHVEADHRLTAIVHDNLRQGC